VRKVNIEMLNIIYTIELNINFVVMANLMQSQDNL
jgi:hypothetical protein